MAISWHMPPTRRSGLDARVAQGDLSGAMLPIRLPPTRPLLTTLPVALRRVAGWWLLALTFWMASILALFH